MPVSCSANEMIEESRGETMAGREKRMSIKGSNGVKNTEDISRFLDFSLISATKVLL